MFFRGVGEEGDIKYEVFKGFLSFQLLVRVNVV